MNFKLPCFNITIPALPQEIIDKISSGKFWLTIICGVVFAYCAMKKILPEDKVMEIILIVVYAYFTKQKENGAPK